MMGNGGYLEFLLISLHLVAIRSVIAGSIHPDYQALVSNTSSQNTARACVHSSRWVQERIQFGDCFTALGIFRSTESDKSSTRPFVFVAPGARSLTPNLSLATPRKYYYGVCVIVVAMLASYPIEYLPPAVEHTTFPTSDIATMGDLQAAAQSIVAICTSRGFGGWVAQGRPHVEGIAVSVWEIGSFIDTLISTPFNASNASAAHYHQ